MLGIILRFLIGLVIYIGIYSAMCGIGYGIDKLIIRPRTSYWEGIYESKDKYFYYPMITTLLFFVVGFIFVIYTVGDKFV